MISELRCGKAAVSGTWSGGQSPPIGAGCCRRNLLHQNLRILKFAYHSCVTNTDGDHLGGCVGSEHRWHDRSVSPPVLRRATAWACRSKRENNWKSDCPRCCPGRKMAQSCSERGLGQSFRELPKQTIGSWWFRHPVRFIDGRSVIPCAQIGPTSRRATVRKRMFVTRAA